jgi:hypothetical protein
VELPIDTHPGHYRRETATIHSSAIVKLATQLHHVPPGGRRRRAAGVARLLMLLPMLGLLRCSAS